MRRAMDTLVHRGPDSEGLYFDVDVALGMKRLSIVGIEDGKQPIENEDGSLILVCNGEIYNYTDLRLRLEQAGHVFSTSSDAEVIVHGFEHYGTDVVSHLEGQFAFVIYDKRNNCLHAARDRYGICPFYWHQANSRFFFASEVKALLSFPNTPRRLNLAAVEQLITFPGVVSPASAFEEIHSLPPGHLLTANLDNVVISQYWALDYPTADNYESAKSCDLQCNELLELLNTAISRRLQSERDIGIYLSGGLDSSLVASIANSTHPGKIKAGYSIAFEQPDLDERKYQELIANHAGIKRCEIVVTADDLAANFERMIWHSETPVKETYNVCSLLLAAAARADGCAVVLCGDGADELFGGYPSYVFDNYKNSNNAGLSAEQLLASQLRKKAFGSASINYETCLRESRDLASFIFSPLARASEARRSVLKLPLDVNLLHGRHSLHQRSYLDFNLRLADHLISSHGDRMSMSQSVESRFPMLDNDLINWVMKVSPQSHIYKGVEKHLLRKCAQGLLPEEIRNRPKKGFRAPGSNALISLGKEWIDDLLSPATIESQGVFDHKSVKHLIDNARLGHQFNAHLDQDLLLVVLSTTLLFDQFNLDPLVE